jgi:hypothetical protein
MLRKSNEHWNINYRCSQLIATYLNGCVAEIFMLGHYLFIMVILTYAVYALIRLDMELILDIGAVVFISSWRHLLYETRGNWVNPSSAFLQVD